MFSGAGLQIPGSSRSSSPSSSPTSNASSANSLPNLSQLAQGQLAQEQEVKEHCARAPGQKKTWGQWFASVGTSAVSYALTYRVVQAGLSSGAIKNDPKKGELQQFLRNALPETTAQALLDALPRVAAVITNIFASKYNLTSSIAKQNAAGLLESFLLRVLVNLVTATQLAKLRRHPASANNPNSANTPVTITEVIAYLISIVKKHTVQIASDMLSIESAAIGQGNNPNAAQQRENQVKAAFSPLAAEILNIVLPKKNEALALCPWINEDVWNTINDPSNFATLYTLLMGSQAEDAQKVNALKQTPGGNDLLTISQACAELVAVQAPKLSVTYADLIGTLVSQQLGVDIGPWVKETLRDLAGSQKEEIAGLWKFLGERTFSTLNKAICHMAMAPNGNALVQDPFSSVTTKFKHIFTDFISDPSDAQFAQDTIRAFVQTFFATTGIERALPPFASAFGLTTIVQDQISRWLCAAYVTLIQGHPDRAIAPLQTKLHRIYGTRHVQELSHVLAQFGKAFVPHLLATQSNEMAKNFKVQIDHLKSRNIDVTALLTENIRKVGAHPELATTWNVLGDYVELIILKLMNGASQSFHKIERNADGSHNPEFMMDMTRFAMNHVIRHVERVNAITKKVKKTYPHQVPKEKMEAEFRAQKFLHKGLQGPEQREEWFKSLTQRLLRLADMDARSLPFPESVREQLFTLLTTSLWPQILQTVFEQMSNEHTQNGLKITMIDTLQGVCEALSNQAPVQAAQPAQPAQPAQRSQSARALTDQELKAKIIKKNAAKLIKEMVNLLPNTLVHGLIKNVDGLRHMSASVLGDSIQGQVAAWPITRIIQQAAQSTIPSMHPGTWGGGPAHDVFQPATVTRRRGVDTLTNADRLKFSFTPTAQEVAWEKERVQMTARAFFEKSKKLGNTGLDVSIEMALANFWKEKIAGPLDAKLPKFLSTFIKGILRDLGYLLYIFYPIYLVGRLIQKAHISNQVWHLNKSFSHPIHENLVLQLIDVLLDSAIIRKEQMEAEEKHNG